MSVASASGEAPPRSEQACVRSLAQGTGAPVASRQSAPASSRVMPVAAAPWQEPHPRSSNRRRPSPAGSPRSPAGPVFVTSFHGPPGAPRPNGPSRPIGLAGLEKRLILTTSAQRSRGLSQSKEGIEAPDPDPSVIDRNRSESFGGSPAGVDL